MSEPSPPEWEDPRLKTQTTADPLEDPAGYLAELREMLAERGGSHPGLEEAISRAEADLPAIQADIQARAERAALPDAARPAIEAGQE